jgi:hypothetical protein
MDRKPYNCLQSRCASQYDSSARVFCSIKHIERGCKARIPESHRTACSLVVSHNMSHGAPAARWSRHPCSSLVTAPFLADVKHGFQEAIELLAVSLCLKI